MPCLLVSVPTLCTGPLSDLCDAVVFAFMCFLLVTLLFDVTPGRGAEVLSLSCSSAPAGCAVPSGENARYRSFKLLRASLQRCWPGVQC